MPQKLWSQLKPWDGVLVVVWSSLLVDLSKVRWGLHRLRQCRCAPVCYHVHWRHCGGDCRHFPYQLRCAQGRKGESASTQTSVASPRGLQFLRSALKSDGLCFLLLKVGLLVAPLKRFTLIPWNSFVENVHIRSAFLGHFCPSFRLRLKPLQHRCFGCERPPWPLIWMCRGFSFLSSRTKWASNTLGEPLWIQQIAFSSRKITGSPSLGLLRFAGHPVSSQ